MIPTTRLLSIATATPPYVIRQSTAAAVAHKAFADRFPDFDQLRPVFDNAGIATRYGVRPIDWYLEPRGWPERTAAYLEGGCALFIASAKQAIAQAGLKPQDIDVIVTVSSTGIATPSIEARVMGALGFRPGVMRVPVFGLGCAGGVSGLSIAARLARAQPGANVLLVALEICTLSFRLDKLTKANVVATALFGDGAAACVLRADEEIGLAEVEGAGEYTWPDTLGIMGWDVDPQGFGVIFDRDIPPFAEQNIAPALEAILGGAGLDFDDIDRFVFHPGGMKVLHAVEHALWLGQGALDHERDVLSDYGNMSGPTALFVLKRVIDKGLPDRVAVTAMGPGFTATCVALKRAA
jgi:alkylresorcinol/alkylpyrone synthase